MVEPATVHFITGMKHMDEREAMRKVFVRLLNGQQLGMRSTHPSQAKMGKFGQQRNGGHTKV